MNYHPTQNHWANRMELELEGSHDAKVSPATSNPPEQVTVNGGVVRVGIESGVSDRARC